jgi:LemA protein
MCISKYFVSLCQNHVINIKKFTIMEFLVTLLVLLFGGIIILAIAVVAYFVMTQRKLVSLDELCKNATGQIAVQLNSRWDAVQGLVKMTAQYAKHESETLTNVINARRISNIQTPQQINEQQSAISEVMGRLMAVSESYPNLKADSMFLETMNGMKQYEENVRMSRMVYNDTATKMNRLVRQWPSSMVASMLHFGEKEYLTVDEEKKSGYPDIDGAFGK